MGDFLLMLRWVAIVLVCAVIVWVIAGAVMMCAVWWSARQRLADLRMKDRVSDERRARLAEFQRDQRQDAERRLRRERG
jgi:hypothetical protein